MVLRPFNLEAALRGEPVVTRDGRDAQVLSRAGKSLIMVRVPNVGTIYHDIDGTCGELTRLDLFMRHTPKDASAPNSHAPSMPEPRKHSHYHKDVSKLDTVDVYQVCELFNVDDPSGATQHALKKLLCLGRRGVKDNLQDLIEARDTLDRRIKMLGGE